MNWIAKIFSGKRSADSSGATGVAKSEAPVSSASTPRTISVLPEDVKSRFSSFIQKATEYLYDTRPSVNASWLGRIAVVMAEAGFHSEAVDRLVKAREVIRNERDGISADSTLSELTVSFAKSGNLLNDAALLDRAMELVNELKAPGFRGIALAKMFGHLMETGSAARAEVVKKRMMTQMDFLTGFDYALTVGGVITVLSKIPSAKGEVEKLLETGLDRARSDKMFGDTALRDMASSYAEAGQNLSDRKMIERAFEIAKEFKDASMRASICKDAAMAYAEMGLYDEAKQCLAKLDNEITLIQDDWNKGQAEIRRRVARVIVGTSAGDSTLIEEGLKDIEEGDDRELALISIVEAMVDLAKIKKDSAIINKAAEVAEKLDKAGNRYSRLTDRVDILCQSGRREDAEALIEKAQSAAETVSDRIDRGSLYLSIGEALLRTAIPNP